MMCSDNVVVRFAILAGRPITLISGRARWAPACQYEGGGFELCSFLLAIGFYLPWRAADYSVDVFAVVVFRSCFFGRYGSQIFFRRICSAEWDVAVWCFIFDCIPLYFPVAS